MANPLYNSVVWVPSDPTGATDMASELETFVTNNQGNMVVQAPGTVALLRDFGQKGIIQDTDDILLSNLKLKHQNDARCIDVRNTQNASAEVVATHAIGNHGRTITSDLTLNSTLGIVSHDVIAVYSDDPNPSKSGGYLGEIKQVITDEATFVVQTNVPLARPSLWSNNIRVRKLDKTRKFEIHGIDVVSDGDVDDLDITTRERCVYFEGFCHARIYKPSYDKPWSIFIIHACCFDAQIDKIFMANSFNTASSNGYTYGVSQYGMNESCTVTNAVTINCRHPAFTTDGNSSNTSTWHQRGYPSNYTCRGVDSYHCYGNSTDSHEEGANGLVCDVTAHYPVQDRAATLGITHQSRAYNETISNIKTIGGSGGIRVSNVDHGKASGIVNKVKICDFHSRDISNNNANAEILDIQNRASADELVVYLDNCSFTDSDRGISVGKYAKLIHSNVTVHGSKMPFDINEGSITIGSNTTFDFSDCKQTGTHYCVNVRSAVGIEPTIYWLDSPKVIRNGSDFPRHFWNENDTNANKNVYHPGVTVIDLDSGASAMVDKEAGETTFVNATADVSTLALGA